MGNDQSHLSGLEIHEKAVEVTDFWAHHSATLNTINPSTLSVFIGEPLIGGSLWVTQTPLEKASKNLMIYRHPCILKYISSWHKNSKFYLAVEDVKPLNHVLSTLSSLQVCIGLHSVLKALCFLHEKASTSHNNVCIASIYVTKDGNWKLGGMEYLCKFTDLNNEYLSKTRSHRYDKAIDPNEDKNIKNNINAYDAIDVFAFGILVCEVLKKKSNDEIESLINFQEFCKNEAQNVDVSKRPKLKDLLEHPFFNHEFIKIHSFLVELPLKSDEEKTQFFSSLYEKLRQFDEVTVASQFGTLLLSRMVLLNKTAQNDILPFVLSPRRDASEENLGQGLFSEAIFKKYLVPKLLEIFCVRDTQIRFLLLSHFIHFMNMFSEEELESQILPELLVGIKDTNDQLVAITLRALADLVSILGAAVVIGGKRAKLFNDGRPIVHHRRRSRQNSKRQQDIIELNDVPHISSENNVNLINSLDLPERPRPDGEEGETSTEEIEQSVEDDLDNWEDWDVNESNGNTHDISDLPLTETTIIETDSENLINSEDFKSSSLPNTQFSLNKTNTICKKNVLPDINELDIKSHKNDALQNAEECDFFQDMEPVIEHSSKFLIDDIKKDIESDMEIKFDKLNLNIAEHGEDGWGDEDWN